MTHMTGTYRNFIVGLVAGLIVYTGSVASSMGATLLPNGEQVFLDNNGNPLAAGTVEFYIPNTTTEKDTYQDADGNVLNTNPVQLDAAGRAIIYGVGCYRQIVKSSAGVEIWDQLTCDTSNGISIWAGTATGTPNAIILDAPNFTGEDGQVIRFLASATNSGATTINPSSFGTISVVVDSGAGPIALTGGEIVADNIITVVYDSNGGVFHMSTLTTITAGAGLSTGGVGTSGGVIAVTGTLTSVRPLNAQTDVTYTLLNTDNAKRVTFSNSSSVAVTVPSAAAANFTNGYYVEVQNLGEGLVTLSSTSTINGASSMTLPTGAGGILVSDGTNWAFWGGRGVTAALSSGGGNYSNLVVANTVGTENTSITVTANFVVLYDTNGFSYRASSVSVACNYTTNGANGLDSGSLANATWYYHWVISNGSNVACLGSTSSTAPTMPSGYTYKFRVGASYTSGSAVFYRFYQYGDKASWKITAATNTTAFPTIASGATSGNFSVAAAAPPTAGEVDLLLKGSATDVCTGGSVGTSGQSSAGNLASSLPSTTDILITGRISLQGSTSVAYNGNDGGCALYLRGWVDNL